MSTDFKLDIATQNDSEEPPLSNIIASNLSLDEKGKSVHTTFNGIREHGKLSPNNYATNAERRALYDRFLKGNKATTGDNDSFHVDEEERHRLHGSTKKKSVPLISGTAYCISSCSMIMLNKIVLSSYDFNAGISLMFYQNFISTLVVVLLALCGRISVEKLNWKLVRVWLPVNVIFIAMLVSGMYSLKYTNIAMVTILKNVTNILTAIGELYLFRKRQSSKVWTAMFVMIISAVSGGITDLSFDAVGYAWQIMNCILTASYSLTLRWVMDEAKKSTKSGSLNEVSMVLLNNLLSLPFAIIMIFLFGEWDYVIHADVVKLPAFWFVATASGLIGLSISFTSMWFLHQTSPTTYSSFSGFQCLNLCLYYSLVGSLNKIPISIAGILVFKVPLSVSNLFSILFGLFAGILFARAKMS
ncbi:golgi nucleotide sugar transporter [Trifolium repens]|nr:golgi nucleotide sugar transporter [Trifolium repens]